jgi:4-hydroxy-2-oxoheptanedioate aldolase
MACRLTGTDLVVRVPRTAYDAPMRALENGAQGIMAPHCHNGAEAEEWVRWCKFPPLGERGWDGSGVDADFSLGNPREYLARANSRNFLMVQIEDAGAVERADEIARVAGVDLLFIGLGDLSISLGLNFEVEHPCVQEAIRHVAASAARHGKWWGMANGTPAAAQAAVDAGARLICCGSDHQWLIRGSEQAARDYAAVRIPEA